MRIEELTEGLIKIPEEDAKYILRKATAYLLSFFYMAYLYKNNNETFLRRILMVGKNYDVYEDELKHIASQVSADKFEIRDFRSISDVKTYSFEKTTYFVEFTLDGKHTPHYNPNIRRISLDLMWIITRFMSMDYIIFNNDDDFPLDRFEQKKLNDMMNLLEDTIRHELMHMVQFLSFEKKDKSQTSTGDNYNSREVGMDGYYGSNVEYYPQIQTALSVLQRDIPLASLQTFDKKTLNEIVNFFVVNKNNEFSRNFKNDVGIYFEVGPSAFFMSLKKLFLEQKDTKKRNAMKFSYQRAIREFYKELYSKLDKIDT